MSEARNFAKPQGVAAAADPESGAVVRHRSAYVAVARRLIAERSLRSGIIEPSLIGEPAWDILLAAYAAEPGVHRSVVEACSVNQIPFIAGFRWFKVLEGANLMQRAQVPVGDYAEAALTPHGKAMLESYFDTILTAAP